MLEHALAYAKRGWSVFPLFDPNPKTGYCACGRPSGRRQEGRCESKHPRMNGGFKKATTDENQIRRWWGQWPDASIGIPGGAANGFFVVDLDEKEAEGISGGARWAELVAANGPDNNPPEIETGSGGMHLLYKYVDGISTSTGSLPEGIDIRGSGGYIVAPPSIHYSGRRYAWANDGIPADPPEWLLTAIRTRTLVSADGLASEDLGPPHVVTVGDLREFLSKNADPNHLQVCRAVLEGTSWAPQRHNKMVAFLGALRMFIMNRYNGATVDPEGTSLLFEKCCEAATLEGVNSITDTSWIARLLRTLSVNDGEYRARLKATAEVEQAKAEQFIDELAANGANLKQSHYPLTHSGNAERLIDTYGNLVRYVPEWKKWLAWDGKRWVVSADGAEVSQYALAIARSIMSTIPYEVDPVANEDMKKAFMGWAKNSESAQNRTATKNLVAEDPRIRVSFESLDNDEYLFNVKNGVIDLKTGQLMPHSPTRQITKLAPVDYNPNAKCPMWEKFIHEAMDGSEEMAKYLQRWAGYMLTGSVKEHALMFNRGGGGNGKGTFFAQLTAIWGSYATTCEADLLLKSYGTKHSTGLTDLFRVRLAITSEIEEGRAWDEPLLKRLTGGDTITARRMREDNWSFTPTHKLAVQSNTDPVVNSTDNGVWRRMHAVPFGVDFRDRADKDLPKKLDAEQEGILAWCVRGCLEWQRMGLAAPQQVVEATKTYRMEQDSLGQFLSERCVLGEEYKVTRSELRAAYEEWCKENGEKYSLSPKKLVSQLKRLGLTQLMCKRQGREYSEAGWKGIKLIQNERDRMFAVN